ncbi:hypothetical protein GCM10010412_041180 [Nonomuraea recticatena]|uniref:Uncharacterized protein n=2 Tax=Nonomuraea recticatena TaxID=46178 RepID=A0ABN3S0L2_9ACTN
MLEFRKGLGTGLTEVWEDGDQIGVRRQRFNWSMDVMWTDTCHACGWSENTFWSKSAEEVPDLPDHWMKKHAGKPVQPLLYPYHGRYASLPEIMGELAECLKGEGLNPTLSSQVFVTDKGVDIKPVIYMFDGRTVLYWDEGHGVFVGTHGGEPFRSLPFTSNPAYIARQVRMFGQ